MEYSKIKNNKNKILKIKIKGIENITNMSYMLDGCSSLLNLPDISKWNTNNVTDMYSMFSGCLNIIISKIITEQFK